jgi:hypothetical protein
MVMKRASTLKKAELLKQLNWLERKNKMNKSWDNTVKLAFASTGSFSFEEMIHKDVNVAEQLTILFK